MGFWCLVGNRYVRDSKGLGPHRYPHEHCHTGKEQDSAERIDDKGEYETVPQHLLKKREVMLANDFAELLIAHQELSERRLGQLRRVLSNNRGISVANLLEEPLRRFIGTVRSKYQKEYEAGKCKNCWERSEKPENAHALHSISVRSRYLNATCAGANRCPARPN